MSTPKPFQNIAVDSRKAMPLSHDRAWDTKDEICNSVKQEVLCLIVRRREWDQRVKAWRDDVKIESIDIGVPKHILAMQNICDDVMMMQNIRHD